MVYSAHIGSLATSRVGPVTESEADKTRNFLAMTLAVGESDSQNVWVQLNYESIPNKKKYFAIK